MPKFEAYTLREILAHDVSGNLVLPDFQRAFVWKREGQRKLAASFIADIPIGSTLILDGQAGQFAARRPCFQSELLPGSGESNGQRMYLLDGQQRTSSLKAVFSDLFAESRPFEEAWGDLFPELRARWAIRVDAAASSGDIFGWRNLRFPGLSSNIDSLLDPEEVAQRIHSFSIEKDEVDRWHHPLFRVGDEGLSEAMRRFRIAEAAAAEGLAPLWELSRRAEAGQGLHHAALKVIASKRAMELQAEFEGDRERIIELLSPSTPQIQESYDFPGAVTDAWASLQAQWVQEVYNAFEQLLDHQIPTAELPSRELSRAIAIFENINKGGTPLSVFDLVVARAATVPSGTGSLRDRLVRSLRESIGIPASLGSHQVGAPTEWSPKSIGAVHEGSPSSVARNQFLNLLSILALSKTSSISDLRVEHIKRERMLNLSAQEIHAHTPAATEALTRAFAFLQMRCGIVSLADISYDLMLLPIGYALCDDALWMSAAAIDKVEYWYWASLFGGFYRDKQNQRCVEDLRSLTDWLAGGENPFADRVERVMDSPDYSNLDVLLMRVRGQRIPKAVHRGVLQYILSRQPRDFLPEAETNMPKLKAWDVARAAKITVGGREVTLKLQDHHVIPLAGAAKLKVSTRELRSKPSHILNSVLNRTYISAVANRRIGALSPEQYLEHLEALAPYQHMIPAGTPLRKDVGETAQHAYERILTARFETLRSAVQSELAELE